MLQRVGMGNVIENFRSRHESNLSKGSKIIRKSRTYKKYNRGPQHVKRYNLKGANVNALYVVIRIVWQTNVSKGKLRILDIEMG